MTFFFNNFIYWIIYLLLSWKSSLTHLLMLFILTKFLLLACFKLLIDLIRSQLSNQRIYMHIINLICILVIIMNIIIIDNWLVIIVMQINFLLWGLLMSFLNIYRSWVYFILKVRKVAIQYWLIFIFIFWNMFIII